MAIRKSVLIAFAVAIWAASPAPASADFLFTPFIGANFGGSASFAGAGIDIEDEFERALNYGASMEIGGGGVGFEIDFGYSPNFFTSTATDSGFNVFGKGNVTTLTGNLVIGFPAGAVRPYIVGGGGLIRSSVQDVSTLFDDINASDLGVDVGAGVIGYFNDKVGIRGDVRYFRSLQDTDPDGVDLALGSFKFWRGTVGVTFKF